MLHTCTERSDPDPHLASRAAEIVTALSMTVGRGAAARMIAELADSGPETKVVDIGCGPGTAVRAAVHRGAVATGVDPSPLMLRLARGISQVRGMEGIAWLDGSAENLPLPDGSATVAWALSSVHHWRDRRAGLAEVHRVLSPGGRVLLAERLTRPAATGHAAHGLTPAGAEALATDLERSGFRAVHTETRKAGRRTFVIVAGTRRPAG